MTESLTERLNTPQKSSTKSSTYPVTVHRQSDYLKHYDDGSSAARSQCEQPNGTTIPDRNLICRQRQSFNNHNRQQEKISIRFAAWLDGYITYLTEQQFKNNFEKHRQ